MFDIIYKLNDLINNDSVYWFCALTGTGMFLIQFILNFVGLGDHDNIDDGNSADTGKFKWLSRQALTGFLMMFGWSALTCRNEFNLEGFVVIPIAFTAGTITIFATGAILKIAKQFHSSGSVFKVENAIGKEATVYQRIPYGGVGKITVSLNDITREIDAITSLRDDLASFTRVQIVGKADDNTVIVKKI